MVAGAKYRGEFEERLQGRPQGDHRRRGRGHHLRRRAAHDRRCRRRRGRGRRRQHDQADAGARRAAHDRRDDARRVPQVRREGPRARAPVPAGVRGRAVGRRHGGDPARAEGALRGPPRRAHPGRRARRGRDALRPLHHRPPAPRQGDRPGRRGRVAPADRDRLDAVRDRRRRAAHPPARDREGGAEPRGREPTRRRRLPAAPRRDRGGAVGAGREARRDGRPLAEREGRDRRDP